MVFRKKSRGNRYIPYRPQYPQRKSPKLLRSLLPLVLIVLGYVVYTQAYNLDPVEAYARTLKETALKGETTLELLKQAAKSKALKPWALLKRGRTLAQSQKYREALLALTAVSPRSPASVEARVALLNLPQTPPIEVTPEALAKLKQEIQELSLPHLLAEVALYQARKAATSGALLEAQEYYLQARQERITRAIAREELSALRDKHPRVFFPNAAPSLLLEAKRLLKEKAFIQALAATQQAKEQIQVDNAAYYELLALEEQILRKLKRHNEADHLLLTISAEAEEIIAAPALLRIAKNAWNVNEQGRALEFLDRLQERFPSHVLNHESNYIRGRIFEELEQHIEAVNVYQKLLGKKDFHARALRRLAWIYYRRDNFLEASKHFALLQDTEDRAHGLYWQARSLEQIDSEVWKEQRIPAKSVSALLRELITKEQDSYYATLAKRELGESIETSSEEMELPSEEKGCLMELSKDFQNKLQTLSDPRLSDILLQEIKWHFLKHYLPPSSLESQAIEQEKLPTVLTYLHTLNRFYNEKHSIGPAARLRKKPLTTCRRILQRLSYPLPYKEVYRTASKQNGVPLELLYAISRTESHFDATATSVTGARGLMQLMPATAEQMGLEPEGDITAVDTNIALGSRYFAKMLKRYGGEKMYALAAYNAGGGAVERWRERYPELTPTEWVELISYPETYSYVQKVSVAEEEYTAILSKNQQPET